MPRTGRTTVPYAPCAGPRPAAGHDLVPVPDLRHAGSAAARISSPRVRDDASGVGDRPVAGKQDEAHRVPGRRGRAVAAPTEADPNERGMLIS
jgi:hypothetical protein